MSDEEIQASTEIRRIAEQRMIELAKKNVSRSTHEVNNETLIHELQVHQIELEMQNEALRAAQIELQQARDRYANLYDFAPLGYLSISFDGIITEINLTGANLLGWDRNRLLNRRFAESIQPSDQDRWTQIFINIKRTGGLVSEEFKLKRADGSVFPAHINLAQNNMAGEVNNLKGDSQIDLTPLVRVSIVDMTAHKKREMDLIAEKTRFAILFNSIPESLFIYEIESGKFTLVNQFACDLYGYTEKEFLTLAKKDIVAPVDIQGMALRANTLKATGEINFESNHIKKDGTIFAVEVNISSMYYEGQKSAMVCLRDIDKRKRDILELDESRNRLRYLLDSLPQNIWLKDLQGKFLDGNLALANALGISKSDFPGKTDFDFFPQELANKFRNDDRRVIETKKIQKIDEKEIIQNRVRYVRTTKIPVLDNQGHLTSTLGIAEDITDLKVSESQILKLVQAVEQSPESIVITDLNADIEFVNESFLYISGYSREELIGKNSRILQSGKTPRENYDQLWQALTNGKRWQGELINRRKNGSEYIEYARIAPIRQEDGTITHYLAVKEDITEKKRNATIVLESKNLLQRIMDSIPDWIFVIDRVNKYMMVNQSYANFFQVSPNSMLGLSDKEIYQALQDEKDPVHLIFNNHENINAVFNGQLITNLKEEITFSNGEVCYFESHWYPLYDSCKKVYGALCYRRNITERVNFEHEQKLLQEQLHQSQKLELVGQFTGGIAHDFNNILASILGYADLLKSSSIVGENPKLEKYVDQILLVGFRARDLIRNLLVFSKINDPHPDIIDPAPVVNEIIDNLLPTLPASISIRSHIAKGTFNVLISPVHLHQVIMNLVLNARDAIADQRGANGTIDIDMATVHIQEKLQCDSCHQLFSGDYVLISVKDNGPGIKQENFNRIFDPFFTTKKISGGTGLGLSVLHGVMHTCNGHIKVQSNADDGTLFQLYLPVSTEVPTTKIPELTSTVVRTQQNARIMVVDDEPEVVNYLKELLESVGYNVIGFSHSQEAIDYFQRNPNSIDLVITDQEMHDLKGAELTQSLLNLHPALPVILCTGFSNEINEQLARKIGVRRFFIKPVPKQSLLDAISDCLNPINLNK